MLFPFSILSFSYQQVQVENEFSIQNIHAQNIYSR